MAMMMISASASRSRSRSRSVPAISSLFLHFLGNTVSSTKTKTRVCSCPRPQFLGLTKQFSNRSRERDSSRDPDREVRNAVALFKRQLEVTDPRPCVKEFTKLLSVISRKKHYFQVISLYKLMCRSRIEPDSYTMNIVINCYCKISNLDGAMGIFKEMEEGGCDCKPNVVTYNTLINGFCKAGKVGDALGLVKKMEEQSFTPNVVTYTALIDGLCKVGNFDAALELLRKMEEGGVEPEKITYFTLINGLKKVGKTDVALELQEKLNEGSGKPCEVRNRRRVIERKGGC